MFHEAGEDTVNWLESTTVQPQIIQKLFTVIMLFMYYMYLGTGRAGRTCIDFIY